MIKKKDINRIPPKKASQKSICDWVRVSLQNRSNIYKLLAKPPDMEGSFSPSIMVARTTAAASELADDDGSSHYMEHDQRTSILESQPREPIPTEWTDEKHSLYLKSMEASFVNQLYNSSDMLGWRAQDDCSSDAKSFGDIHSSTRVHSGEFKVFQDGCWEKVNFRRERSQLNKAEGTRVLSGNLWIRHFRSGVKHQLAKATSATSDQFPASYSHLCSQDSFGSNAEMTDQNFVDEDVESQKASRICSRTKRMKASAGAN